MEMSSQGSFGCTHRACLVDWLSILEESIMVAVELLVTLCFDSAQSSSSVFFRLDFDTFSLDEQ